MVVAGPRNPAAMDQWNCNAMQPIYVGIGLTVSIVALTALVGGPQFVVPRTRTAATWPPSTGRQLTARTAGWRW